MSDLARRARLGRTRLEALAACGALEPLGVGRRQALWAAGPLAQEHGVAHVAAGVLKWVQPALPGTSVGARAPELPPVPEAERTVADLVLTGTTTAAHPLSHLREALTAQGVVLSSDLARVEDGTRVRVAGMVTHHQRPHTAAGTIFLNLEDESGLLNVICSPGM